MIYSAVVTPINLSSKEVVLDRIFVLDYSDESETLIDALTNAVIDGEEIYCPFTGYPINDDDLNVRVRLRACDIKEVREIPYLAQPLKENPHYWDAEEPFPWSVSDHKGFIWALDQDQYNALMDKLTL